MVKLLDEAAWREAFTHPDWYLRIKDDFARLEAARQDLTVHEQLKDEAYGAVEAALREQRIILANHGGDLDSERQPIDRIVIHHTKNKPGMTLERLNAMQLIRIYGSYYAHPTDPREQDFASQPVWSGHFYKEKQVFWGYHWIIREDGRTEQILDDRYIGWHAGNWDINKRSIAICIDDDLSEKLPTELALSAIASVIQEHYPQITPDEVIGHSEAYPGTICPGRLFIPQWKRALLEVMF